MHETSYDLAWDWAKGKHQSVINKLLAKRPKDAIRFAIQITQWLSEDKSYKGMVNLQAFVEAFK